MPGCHLTFFTPATPLTYAYDKNGNLTDSREKGLLVPPLPTPHDVTSAYTAAGRLQTRADAADPTGQKNWTTNSTQGDSFGELDVMLRDAVDGYFFDKPRPDRIQLHFAEDPELAMA